MRHFSPIMSYFCCCLFDVISYATFVFHVFSASTCLPENPSVSPPFLCTAPIKVYALLLLYRFRQWTPWLFFAQDNEEATIMKLTLWHILQYQYANYTNPKYTNNGKGLLKLQLINQRSDFSFALFTGGLSDVCLLFLSPQTLHSSFGLYVFSLM